MVVVQSKEVRMTFKFIKDVVRLEVWVTKKGTFRGSIHEKGAEKTEFTVGGTRWKTDASISKWNKELRELVVLEGEKIASHLRYLQAHDFNGEVTW